MLQRKSSLIHKLQGKDVYDKIKNISQHKRRGATLDYSLGTKQLQNIAYEVLPKKKADSLFFESDSENGKQCTNAIVSLSFDYNLCEYNKVKIKDKVFYAHYKSGLSYREISTILSEELLENGVYTTQGFEEGIELILLGEETSLSKDDLPSGFRSEDGRIVVSSSGSRVILHSSDIRRELYNNGFKLTFDDGKEVEYVRFLRSSGQARVGSCLFILKKLYKPMIKWSYMNLDIPKSKKVDLAGLEAYISLAFSSIIDTLIISKEEILVIDDYESLFETTGMVTRSETIDGVDRLVTSPLTFEQSNSIWDGQSILDESKFVGYEDKGMLLLRNRMAKSCAFNGKIQKFFKDNGVVSVEQLNGFTLAKDISQIKLITTPNSIKYLKYGTLEEFLEGMDEEWGIVKYDKPTKHHQGASVATHYQLLNTLQMTREDMEEFLAPTLEYLKGLKTDIEFLKNHLRLKENRYVEVNGHESKDSFILKMLQINKDFHRTKMFRNFKKNLIASYVNSIKRGHVLVNGNYSTLCGNPIEMLLHSIGKFDGTSILDIDEVCSLNFDCGAMTVNSRSPHVANGNVHISTNCSIEKRNIILAYMNLTKQIVCLNSIGNNILETLSGCD